MEENEQETSVLLAVGLGLVALASGAAAVWLALRFPGTFAYWLGPMLMVPPMIPLYLWLVPWSEIPLARKLFATAMGVLIAGACGALAIMQPEDTTYVIALLGLMPLFTVAVATQSSSDEKADLPSPFDVMGP